MADTWLIADLHLGHRNIIDGFGSEPGDRKGPRAQFENVDHMAQVICDNWASVVKPQDKVYVLGDIVFQARWLQTLKPLPGHKRAVLGNHDNLSAKEYAGVFEKVFGAKVLGDGYLLTHIPVHPSSFNRRSMQVNIHGHLHEEAVMYDAALYGNPQWEPDPNYVCVSCEAINFTPINLDVIRGQLWTTT